MYADDLILLSGSMLHLQLMLDECSSTGQQLDIKFNNVKSKCLIVGPTHVKDLPPMYIDGRPMCWEMKLKYLGVWIISGKRFDIDHSETRRSFFASVNGILSKVKFTDDIVKLILIERHG